MSPDDVRERFGVPQTRDEAGNWYYQREGGLISLEWAASVSEGGKDLQLNAVQTTGPATLQLNGRSLPDFGESRSEISKILGPPEEFLLDGPEPRTRFTNDYCYRWGGQMVIYEFYKDRACRIEIRRDNTFPLPPSDKHA